MIHGFFDGGRPYAQPWVRVSATGTMGQIPFVVDTGAAVTTIHPRDSLQIGIPLLQLHGRTRKGRGVGGKVEYVVQRVQLLFEQEDGEWFSIEKEVNIARTRKGVENLPSLLGRDVLHDWRMDYNPRRGRIRFQT